LGETLREGLIREVREETGIEVEPIALLEVLDHIFHDGVTKGHVDGRVRFHYVLIDFVCGVRGGMLAGASDALEARWVERSQLEGRDIEGQAGFALPVRTREVIQKAFRLLDEGLALI
jgi:ADP-ribose pyrophosphatase YjhB (NUDIX family)